jgi:large subunit ribosomal protein L32e
MDAKTKARLLAIRTQKRKIQPRFVRDECWRYKRVSPSWRRARGIDSKTRRKTKNGVVSPQIGFGTPKAVRGLHPSGLEDVLISKKEDLTGLSTKVHGIRVASKLGAKKKIELIEFAREKGFRILNIGLSREDLTDLEVVESSTATKTSAKQAQIEKLKNKSKEEEKAPEESGEPTEK